jgi:hypothetical protein
MNVVENNAKTTSIGGVTRAGFRPGVSGNPGGRPKGLTRRVRELVGDDGGAIAEFMYAVMSDPSSQTADRLEAAPWLGDRGFGRSVQPVDLDVNQQPGIDITLMSIEDLEALIAMLDKYSPAVVEMTQSGTIPFACGEPSSRQRSLKGRSSRT